MRTLLIRPAVHAHYLLFWCLLAQFWLAPRSLFGSDSFSDVGQKIAAVMAGQVPSTVKTVALREVVWTSGPPGSSEPDEQTKTRLADDIELGLSRAGRLRLVTRAKLNDVLAATHPTQSDSGASPETTPLDDRLGVDCLVCVEVIAASLTLPEFRGKDLFTKVSFRAVSPTNGSVCSAGVVAGLNEGAIYDLRRDLDECARDCLYRELARAICRWAVEDSMRILKVGNVCIWKCDVPPGSPFDESRFREYLTAALAASQEVAIMDPRSVAERVKARGPSPGSATDQELQEQFARDLAVDGFLVARVRQATPTSVEASVRVTSVQTGEMRGEVFSVNVEKKELTARPSPVRPSQPVPGVIPDEPSLKTLEPQPSLPSRQSWWKWTLYGLFGWERDLIDTTFVGLDRIPICGAFTTAVYEYGGVTVLSRLGPGEQFKRVWNEVYQEDFLTWGGFASENPWPAFAPNWSRWGRKSWFLYLVTGVGPALDVLDSTTIFLDRVPVTGFVTSCALFVPCVGVRAINGSEYTDRFGPVRSEGALTFGFLLGDRDRWTLLPNVRAWPTSEISGGKAREILAAWRARNEEIRKRNEDATQEWRRRCDEIRRANADAAARYEEAIAKFSRDEAETAKWNERAAQVNGLLEYLEKEDLLTPQHN